MEPPTKRMKISNPEIRNPRDTGSRRTEGLFTSEMGIRGDDTDIDPIATRTISTTEFQRRDIYGQAQRVPRPVLPRRNAGLYLYPRAPDATVTASVIEINVNDGTTTSKVTEVPAAATGTVVSLSDVGSVTVPALPETSSVVGSASDSTQEIITTPLTTPSSSQSHYSTTSSSVFSTTSSTFSESLNSTLTTGSSNPTTSEERTVTVTATTTYEVSLINGTVIATGYFATADPTTLTVDVDLSSTSTSSVPGYTFGQLFPTSTNDGDSTYGTSATGFPGAAASGTITAPTGSPTKSADADSGSGSGGNSGPGLTPTQQTVVGGVVGGVAGIALALVIVLFVLRWYRRRLKARGQLPEQIAARESHTGPGPSQAMSERSSVVPFAAAVAHNLKRLRPHSIQTFTTTGTSHHEPAVADSERGFQRIAGRKLAPALGSGADPYGGNYGAFEKDIGADPNRPLNESDRGLSGASFYRDSEGFYGGNGSHSPTFPPSPTIGTTVASTGEVSTSVGSSGRNFSGPYMPVAVNGSQLSLGTPSRPDGYAVIRPSPARTPVTLSPAASSIRLPIQQPPIMDEHAPPLPNGLALFGLPKDGVGRSLASQDGSRISKSSGRSAGRFMENI